jgi:GNAT superfamily N-acetyltransferase
MYALIAPRPIREDDDLSAFECGEPDLDDYLRKRALANHVQGTARCFIIKPPGGPVVGYYALATASVQREDALRRLQRNAPQQVPVILLARLAVDRKMQSHGVGKILLRDAIKRTLQVADQVGVRALLVHALHEEARNFYLRFEFEPSPTDDLHLFLTIKDAREAAGFHA